MDSLFQLGTDFCCYLQIGSCPYHFMTCVECPYSLTYREAFSKLNEKRAFEYRSKIIV